MRLFLIRHGETVDNVASLFAGSRDSALTNHGVLQTRRLGSHLAGEIVSPSEVASGSTTSSSNVHIFTSNLQRAVRTAEAVRDALAILDSTQTVLAVTQLALLREKHFGTGEGKVWTTTAPHEGVETQGAMALRADTFLDSNLLPLVVSPEAKSSTVIIVSHGMILSTLFRRLCDRIPSDTLTVAPSLASERPAFSIGGSRPLHPSWSNTGYLEASLSLSSGSSDWATAILTIHRVNATDHLKGLRKTRGGIGSARFDEKQKTIESFFRAPSRKRKLADANNVEQ